MMDYYESTMERIAELVAVGQGESGQCRHVRRFLLGLYNADEWPFELNRLRALDYHLQLNCLAVLRFMTLEAPREIHTYIDDGDAVLKGFWEVEKRRDGA